MALGDSYASVPEYRNWKRSTKDDLFLEWCLEAVSRMLDLRLNQPFGFNKETVASTRVYGPGDLLAPIADTTGLSVKRSGGLETDWAGITALALDTDYELLPRNRPYGWPYTGIYMPTTGLPLFSVSVINPKTYVRDDWRMQVVAICGWPSVPRAIQRATLELTAMLEQESIYTTGRVQELEGVIEASPQARALINRLSEVYNPFPVVVA